MTSEYTKILESNQHQKPQKAPFNTYAGFKGIIGKIDG